ncbi:MAG: riboflavin synthase [Sphingobacteriia bacterium]|jgi:riboflavin synthase
MFTGIIEALGTIEAIEPVGTNLQLWVSAPFVQELKIDQSVAHNGVCLTVAELKDGLYRLDVIQESLNRSSLGLLQPGASVNLERCVQAGQRMDGHFVQGHVDTTGTIQQIENQDGSWDVWISYPPEQATLIVQKGSVAVDGISLTVAEDLAGRFRLSLIPYTWQHTNAHSWRVGSPVNLEFDILGKYLHKHFQQLAPRQA